MSLNASLTNAFRADFIELVPLTEAQLLQLRDGRPRDRWVLADLFSLMRSARLPRGVTWSQPELEDFRAALVRMPPV